RDEVDPSVGAPGGHEVDGPAGGEVDAPGAVHAAHPQVGHARLLGVGLDGDAGEDDPLAVGAPCGVDAGAGGVAGDLGGAARVAGLVVHGPDAEGAVATLAGALEDDLVAPVVARAGDGAPAGEQAVPDELGDHRLVDVGDPQLPPPAHLTQAAV